MIVCYQCDQPIEPTHTKRKNWKVIRQIRIDGDIAYVPITKGYEAVIDVSDVGIVSKFNWSATTGGTTVYAHTNIRCPQTGKYKLISLHRFLMHPPSDLQVDHIDMNGLNNRRSNLRLATQSQNQHNRRRQCNNTSGLKGVCPPERKRDGWRARISINGKQKLLGYFPTKELAHQAYCEANAALHGEYGRYN